MLVKFDELWNVNNYLGGNIIRTDTIIQVDVEVGVAGAGLSLELRVVG